MSLTLNIQLFILLRRIFYNHYIILNRLLSRKFNLCLFICIFSLVSLGIAIKGQRFVFWQGLHWTVFKLFYHLLFLLWNINYLYLSLWSLLLIINYIHLLIFFHCWYFSFTLLLFAFLILILLIISLELFNIISLHYFNIVIWILRILWVF